MRWNTTLSDFNDYVYLQTQLRTVNRNTALSEYLITKTH